MATIRQLMTETGESHTFEVKCKPETLQKVTELLISFDGNIPDDLENDRDSHTAIYKSIQEFTFELVITNKFLLEFWKKDSQHHALLSDWCRFGKMCGKFWEVVDRLSIPSDEVLKMEPDKVGKEQYLEYVKSLKTPLDEKSLGFLYSYFYNYVYPRFYDLPGLENLGFKGLKYSGISNYSLASDEHCCNIIDVKNLIINGEIDVNSILMDAMVVLFKGMLFGSGVDSSEAKLQETGSSETKYNSVEERELDLCGDSDIMTMCCVCRTLKEYDLKGTNIDLFNSIRDYPTQDEDLKTLRQLIADLM